MVTEKVKQFLSWSNSTSRSIKKCIIEDAPLKEREIKILVLRYVIGKQVKEVAEELNIETDALVKAQKKAIDKFYTYYFNN